MKHQQAERILIIAITDHCDSCSRFCIVRMHVKECYLYSVDELTTSNNFLQINRSILQVCIVTNIKRSQMKFVCFFLRTAQQHLFDCTNIFKNCRCRWCFTSSRRGIGKSFQLAIITPRETLIGYDIATAQS